MEPFSSGGLFAPIDATQHGEVVTKIEAMIELAGVTRFEETLLEMINTMEWKNKNVFRAGLSLEPPTKFEPLIIKLVADAESFHARLRNYTQEKRAFLTKQVAKLVGWGMVYFNSTSPWAFAPWLVPKDGSAKFCFAMDLCSVSLYSIEYQYQISHTEQELVKVLGSKYFLNVEFCQSYKQLALDLWSQAT